jgi:hypothetical protein
MSAVEPTSKPISTPMTREAFATILPRIGAIVAVSFVLSLAVNAFAGSLAFALLLTGLTLYSAHQADAAPQTDEEAAAVEPEPATPPLAPSTPAGAALAR